MAQKLGNARLAIPKVNKNPGIAVKRAIGGVGKVATTKPVATVTHTLATTPSQPSNTVPATQSTPVDPMANAPVPGTPAPTGLFDLPAYAPPPGQADPRDASYWANLAKLKFSDEQEYSKGLRAQTRADTDYGDALQTAIRNRAVQQRSLGEDAIRGNLSASGWLDRNESEQTTAYTQDRAHAAKNKEEEDQARTAARNAILQSFGLDAGGLLAEAGDRYAQRKREEAEAIEAAPSGGEGAGGGASGGGTGDTPTGAAAGPFWGAKDPGGYDDTKKKKNPAKQAISDRRKAR
jgi:hypothetical protein